MSRKVSRPTDGATASTNTFSPFSTPWTATINVAAGQSVRVCVSAVFFASTDSLNALGIAKDGVLVNTMLVYTAGGGQRSNTATFEYVDDAPSAGSHTYAVWGAVSGSETMTLQNVAPSAVISFGTGGGQGGRSVMTVEAFTEL